MFSVDKCFVNYYAKMVAILVPLKYVFESCIQNFEELNERFGFDINIIKFINKSFNRDIYKS